MKSTHSYRRYGISKLCQILETNELAKRYPESVAVSVHPGRVGTKILSGYLDRQTWEPMAVVQRVMEKLGGSLSVDKGAWTSVWAAVTPVAAEEQGQVESGGLYCPVGVKKEGSKRTRDDKSASTLWNWVNQILQGSRLL